MRGTLLISQAKAVVAGVFETFTGQKSGDMLAKTAAGASSDQSNNSNTLIILNAAKGKENVFRCYKIKLIEEAEHEFRISLA